MTAASRPLPLLPLTVVGSHPRPSWWYLALDAYKEGRFGSRDLEETLRHAVDLAILDQERLGIDVITDGEMTRLRGFSADTHASIQGLREVPSTERRWGPPHWDNNPRYVVEGPLNAPNGLGIVEQFRYLREHTTSRTKVTCPGAYALARSYDVGPPYADVWELAGHVADLVNAELKACVAAGADFVQVDEPSVTLLPRDGQEMLDLVNRTFAGIAVKKALHTCFGTSFGRPRGYKRSYRPLFPYLLEAQVDQVSFEFTNRQWVDIELWQEYQPQQELVVGVVDQKAFEIETPEFVAESIRHALQFVPAEKLWISPDCGLAREPYWLGLAKLRAMVEGTAIVRRELTGTSV
jgi:5-methyltetrahydropteroyltriglutamate--homocysteine methyltransferase